MNITRFKSILVLLCLCFAAQRIDAQCNIALSANLTHVSCFGGGNGAIDLTVAGGTPPFTFQWSNGVTDMEDIFDLPSGQYIVTVTDALGCNANLARTINQPTVLAVGISGDVIDCVHVYFSGLPIYYTDLSANANGGTAPYFYVWSNNGNGVTQRFTEAGTYTVTVIDGNSCLATAEKVVLTDTIPPSADAGPDLNFDCQTAQLTLGGNGSASGPGISYKWTGPGITNGANGNIADRFPIVKLPGVYTLEVNTLSNYCSGYDVVMVGGAPPPIAKAGPDTGIPCGSGQINLDGSGSTTGIQYAYQWSTANGNIVAGATSLNPIVNMPGIYTLMVTDLNNGCTRTDAVKVFPGPIIPQADFFFLNVSCTGQLGEAGVTMTQGTAPYNYLWSTGSTQANTINVVTGTYTVTVTDSVGCTRYAEVTVEQDTPFFTLSASSTQPTCVPGNNGTIDLTVSGLQNQIVYLWATGETTQDINNLGIGTYTVTVTDFSTCSSTLSVTLTSPSGMTLSTVATDASCDGNDDGSIDLTVSGGAPGYTYFWGVGLTTEDLVGIIADTYTVTVTDAMGCTETASTSVGQPVGSFIDVAITASTNCAISNGAIDITEVPPAGYNYIWSTGSTTQDLTNLSAGNYTVTVSAGVGCTIVFTWYVPSNSNLPNPSVVTTPTTCDISNGSIDASVTGGVAPFSYIWSNGATTQDMSNIISGNYVLTVTGSNGCTNTISVNVTNSNPPITLTGTTAPNTICTGNPNGSIDLQVAPAGSYTYQWSDGATVQDLNGLLSGIYFVTVSAGGSCTQETSFDVPANPNGPSISLNVTDASCNGNDGGIDLTVSGGTPAYTYLWMDGATAEDRAGLASSTYTVTVTDFNGCTQTASTTVGQPSGLTLSALVIASTSCAIPNGAIDITVVPTGTYTYVWSNGSTTQNLSGMPSGNYTVTVSAGGGCTVVDTYFIPFNANLPTASASITPSTCNLSNGSIDVSITGGVPPYNYQWSNAAGTQDLSNIQSGIYMLTVTGANGCSNTISVDVPNNNLTINLTGVVTPNTTCSISNGSIDLSATPVASYTFTWSNGSTTQDLTNLPAGSYTVTVSAGGSCTQTASFNVPDNSNGPNFSIISLSNNCSSETITGPNLPNFTYQWSGPNGFISTAAAITANFSGLYALTVTDANGCTATNNYAVNLTGGGACGALTGRVFHDEDESCSLDLGEPGLAGWIVRAEGANDTLYGVTNAQGQYLVGVPVGTYAMKVFVPNGLWTVCPGGVLATVGMSGDTVFGGDFPVKASFICPALTISLGTKPLRRCFGGNYYEVEYCNQGTQKAEDAFVTVALDPFLSALSSSIPYSDLGANLLRFEVGDLDIGECGSFSIQVYVNCNAVFGQAHCTQASIYPDTLCAPVNTNWSGASLSVQSVCNPDSLRFIIRNDGKANMSNSANYIVVEDGIMFRSGVLAPLAENDSMVIAVPANGSTWRVEVGQEAFHPYPAPVGLSVEGCATTSSFSTGFVNQFPTPDESPAVDIDCTTNIGSFDPNDKYGYPVGYGADHYVRPGTDIEYLVRFQNTGTDTAFRVEIIDTLSAWLDPATIRFGAASHPYRYDLNGEGIVHFIFEDILLPDSNTNEVASHGFAKFIIKPRFDAPLETIIENTAAIYFDFNDPVYTNTTFHRLGVNFITVGLWQPIVPEARVIAVPNPFSEETTLEVNGLRRNDALRLQVFDLQGHVLREMESENAFFHLRKGDWQSGIYLFKITQSGRLVGSGKLMAE